MLKWRGIKGDKESLSCRIKFYKDLKNLLQKEEK